MSAAIDYQTLFPVVSRRHRKTLRRIADLEANLGIWPPWHFVQSPRYDLDGVVGMGYRLPRPGETAE
jgi:hypothetical protein